jgi:DUF4097 and DUF4098 domain-containing protein YvlB
MSELRTEEFSTPGPIRLRVSQQSGELEVHAEPTETTFVRIVSNSGDSSVVDQTTVELRGDELVIEVPHRPLSMLRRYPKLAISVVVPEGSAVKANLASADLHGHGRLGQVEVNTASGDVQLGDVTGDVPIKSASGDVSLGHTGGRVSVQSASGDLAMRGADGDIELHSASGDIAVGTAGNSVRARTASGDIQIALTQRGAVEVNSASGDVAVGVATGVGVWLDISTMSGSTSTDLNVGDAAPTGGPDLRLTARTISGDVRISRTGPAPASPSPAPQQ